MGKLYKQEGSGHGSSETFPENTYPWHKVTTWPLPPDVWVTLAHLHHSLLWGTAGCSH